MQIIKHSVQLTKQDILDEGSNALIYILTQAPCLLTEHPFEEQSTREG